MRFVLHLLIALGVWSTGCVLYLTFVTPGRALPRLHKAKPAKASVDLHESRFRSPGSLLLKDEAWSRSFDSGRAAPTQTSERQASNLSLGDSEALQPHARNRDKSRYRNTKAEGLLECGSLPTPRMDVKGVVYNRVSKCGSTTVDNALRQLAELNSAKYVEVKSASWISSKDYKALSAEDSRLAKLVNGPASMFYYVGHTGIPLLPTSKLSDLAFINMIRDPVSRMVSSWNYMQFMSKTALTARKRSHLKQMGIKTIHDLLRFSNRTKVISQTPIMLQYHFFCKWNSFAADACTPEEAERHLGRYSAVGLMENMTLSMKLFERQLPHALSGLAAVQEQRLNRAKRDCPRCEALDDTLRSELTAWLADDVEFYRVVKARFEAQVQCAGLDQDQESVPTAGE